MQSFIAERWFRAITLAFIDFGVPLGFGGLVLRFRGLVLMLGWKLVCNSSSVVRTTAPSTVFSTRSFSISFLLCCRKPETFEIKIDF